jgi:DNA-binding transcriptional regulator GbsR (MarR family)
MNLSEKQRELIERIGVFHEHKGMQPLVGRILGLMLVHEEAEVTFEEIVETLGVSKSAVSNALNFLQAKDRIVYSTRPGDRKRYFKLRIQNWREDFERDLVEIAKIKEFIDEVIKERGEQQKEFNSCLRNFSDFIVFFKREIPLLFEKFKKEHG